MTEILYEGPIYGSTGYINTSRNYVLALDKIGIKPHISITSDVFNSSDGGLPYDLILKLIRLSSNSISENAPRIQYAIPELFTKNYLSKKNIGILNLKMNKLPYCWVDKCNLFDQLVVPSKFTFDILIKAGIEKEKIKIIPYIIDTDLFNPDAEPLKIKNKKKFNFLSVFEFSYRKGWDILLEAFWKEFKNSENVSLTLKTYFKGVNNNRKQWMIRCLKKHQFEKNFMDKKNVFIYPHVLPEVNMPNFYNLFDCFISTTRCEDFGSSIAEAMSCGIPIIATNWGGHLDFCDTNNSYLINVKDFIKLDNEMFKIQEMTPYYKGQEWAQPDIDHLRSAMRSVYENHKEAKEKALKGRYFLKKNYSYSIIGEQLKDIIKKD